MAQPQWMQTIHDESSRTHILNEHTSSVCTDRKCCFFRRLIYWRGVVPVLSGTVDWKRYGQHKHG
jgi:hypothetical protein